MAEVKKDRKMNQTEDVREYVELLRQLTKEEKMQVKGIMIGMQMMREQMAVKTA